MSTQLFKACILATAAVLAGCGGAGDSPASSPCTLASTAGCGGSTTPSVPGTPAPPPNPATKVASVTMVFSSNELPSAGTPGSEVAVTALVKTAENTAVAGARVEFSADSGLLGNASALTDAGGKATALLGTGGSRLNRAITVKAKSGTQTASGVVNVTGTQLTFNGPAFVALGGTADLVATLVDSAGKPIAGAPLTASAVNGNAVQVAAASDARGQVPVKFTASTRGTEQLTLSALGASATRSILVGGSDVALTPVVAVDTGGVERLTEVAVGSCAPIGGSYMIGGAGQTGSVTVTASRGMLYRDAACGTALSGPLAFSGGAFPALWIRSDNAGVASIDARVANGPSGSTRVEFVAGLRPTSRVDLQTDLAVVGGGERSTLTAVVRDGSAANNLVKGATVQFSILADPSGGTLLAPFSAVTGSDGIARAVFVAGPADGGKNGTLIQARIAELPGATDVTSLTVNKKALSIQFGTGAQITEVSPEILQKDFAVFVADSAGNPVKDVAISVSAWPTAYRKGSYKFSIDKADPTDQGMWEHADPISTCPNEDVQRKGIYERAYDTNNDGVLEPGIPLSVSVSGKTDATGVATASLRYPRDRGSWVQVELTVSGSVAGTESVARNTFWLPVVAADVSKRSVTPPGVTSPYGVYSCTSAQ